MRQRLLVVDDDDDVRAFLVQALEESGYEVSGVPDGRQALRMLEAQEFVLVLVDFALPGMSGGELVERIRGHRPDQKLLLVSGYAGTGTLRRIAGDLPIVAKPVDVSSLAEAVEAALEGRPTGGAPGAG